MAGLASTRIELAHRGFVGMQARVLSQQLGEPASGYMAAPIRPIHSAKVERASCTPWRAAICSIQYKAR